MASKPASTARWANSGGAIVEPSNGKKDIGWVSGERPPAQYLNWWMKLSYDWQEYLKDGAMSGAFTFDNTVGITGALTCAAVTASGLITANAGVTCGSNQHVTVSGTGKYKHGTVTVQIPVTGIGATTAGTSDVTITGTVQVIIPIRVGVRLLAIRAVIKDSATGPTKLQMGYYTGVAGNTLTQTELGTASAGDGTVQTISRTLAAPPTIATGNVYAMQIIYNTGAANCHVYALEFDFDQQ